MGVCIPDVGTVGAVRRQARVIDGTRVAKQSRRLDRRGARSRAYRRGRSAWWGGGTGGREVWGVRELSRGGAGGGRRRRPPAGSARLSTMGALGARGPISGR